MIVLFTQVGSLIRSDLRISALKASMSILCMGVCKTHCILIVLVFWKRTMTVWWSDKPSETVSIWILSHVERLSLGQESGHKCM